MQPEKLLTIQDIADRLGVERHAAGAYLREMPYIQLRKKRKLVRQGDFEKWLQSQTHYPILDKCQPAQPALYPDDDELFEPDGTLKKRRRA